jgi:hydroxymethylglutaryl-CoA lyase
MLNDMEIETGVNLDELLECARIAQEIIPGELPSKVLKAGPRTQVAAPAGAES